MRSAWPALLAGAILAPLVTWFPMLAATFPGLGLPAYLPAQGIDLWHLQTFILTACAGIALLVARHDRWLGAAILASGVVWWYQGARLNPTHTIFFALGALLLLAAREIPIEWSRMVRDALVGLGLFQLGYVMLQMFLGIDVLWGPLFHGTPTATIQPLGTLGGVNASAGYIAVLAPLMPLWAILLVGVVVWQGHSLGALVTLLVGLGARYVLPRPSQQRQVAMAALALGFAVFLVGMHATGHKLERETHFARLDIWQFAVWHWMGAPDPKMAQTEEKFVLSSPATTADLPQHIRWAPILVGYGLGGWMANVPQQQVNAKHLPTGEIWMEAHNEYLQFVLETGLVGLALLGLWLRGHWRMFAHPLWGPSLCALAVNATTWHPFHIVSSALVGILLVGLATRKETPCAA